MAPNELNNASLSPETSFVFGEWLTKLEECLQESLMSVCEALSTSDNSKIISRKVMNVKLKRSAIKFLKCHRPTRLL